MLQIVFGQDGDEINDEITYSRHDFKSIFFLQKGKFVVK